MLVPRISRRSFPKSSSDASRRLETTRSAEKLGTAPVDQHFIGYSLISANISDFPLTVSVVVSVRESKLIRQQCLSASLAACIPAVRYGPEFDFAARLWRSCCAFSRVYGSRVYSFVTFPW